MLSNKLRSQTSLGVEATTLEDSRLSVPCVGGTAASQQSNVPLLKKAQGKLLPALL
jgi:hypothetical protein